MSDSDENGGSTPAGERTDADDAAVGGTSGSHPEPETLPMLVAPTVEVAQNVLRAFLIPVGCWRIDDLRFDFDSSFIRGAARTEFKLLARVRKDHPQAPLTLFGHADPVGSDDYNKTLSGRRVKAVYGALTSNTDMWEALYSKSFGGDVWGTKQIQRMLISLDEDCNPNGVMDKATIAAIKDFRSKNGLSESGGNNAEFRKALFAAYMDFLCVDDSHSAYTLATTDFLAQGADPKGKGDYQGCSEFNPVLLFSKAEAAKFSSDHIKRNSANAPNRRVMGLLFKAGTVVDPNRWPCPSADDGIAGCKKRFWSDGETRRSNQDAHRTFETDKNTYGCRFYHRLFVLSPCASPGGAPEVVTVLKIQATLPSTKGVRDPSKTRPDAVLPESTSVDTSLTDNGPVVLVRGCNDVQLKAITTPDNQPVTWAVNPIENSNPAPALVPNGNTATLKTNQAGTYSVTATASGGSPVVWNVVFVHVKVDPNAVVVTTRDLYVDNGSDGTTSTFKSGDFVKDKFSFEMNASKVEVIGGGKDLDIGIEDVQIHVIQNGVADTLTGNYVGGGTALEVPHGGLPVVDSNDGTTPFLISSKVFKVTPDNSSALRQVFSADSPTGAFPRRHPNSHKLLQSISGVNGFRTAIVSVSVLAVDAIVVHADVKWTADYSGDISTTDALGKYKANGAATTADAVLTLISEATGGQDAQAAGLETFQPRFNEGVDTKFTP